MMTHLSESQLNDYVDGVLNAADVGIVTPHIGGCSACAGEIDRLREIKTRLASLPREIRPARDLRADMWQKIDQASVVALPRRGTLWSARYRLAAAAVLLVAVSSAVTLLIVRERPAPYAVSGRPSAVPTLVSNSARSLDQQYNGQVEELQALLKKSHGTLAPETIRIMETNLRIIDGAIQEAHTALAADPNSGMLLDLLRSAYERKLELLRQAAKSSST